MPSVETPKRDLRAVGHGRDRCRSPGTMIECCAAVAVEAPRAPPLDERDGGRSEDGAHLHLALIRRRPDAVSHAVTRLRGRVAVLDRGGTAASCVGSADGAASRMKSTGAGGRGAGSSSSTPPRGGGRPCVRLHGAQAVTTFSQTESPPRERGTTWSSVSRPPARPAVDAAPAVAGEQRPARDLSLLRARHADVLDEPDHVRPRERVGRGVQRRARAPRAPPPSP